MTQTEVLNQITECIKTQTPGRVYFKNNRQIIYGFFVKGEDHDELTKKGMVRFVPGNRIFTFREYGTGSMIYAVGLIEHIKTFQPLSHA